MVKRLFKIAVLTGAAHLFTLVTLKLLSEVQPAPVIGAIGEIDSLFQLIINLVGFGLQLSAVRDIASSENWKPVYQQTQTARLTLGLALIPLSLAFLVQSAYLYFFLAPLLALSGDYALYGRSKPVLGAAIAFWRVLIPSVALIVFNYIAPNYLVAAFVISTTLVYVATGIVISKKLGTAYWFRPSPRSLRLYAENFRLGLASLSSYFIGLGIIIIASGLYNDSTIAVAYLALKLYMVFKGVIRIINQAFVKEMLDDRVCERVDQIASLAGISFALCLILFPGSITAIFFDEKFGDQGQFLVLIGLAGFFFSALTSLTTRSLLHNKDQSFAFYSTGAAVCSLLLVILLSFLWNDPVSLGISLLVGELLSAIGLYLINKEIQLKPRFLFLFQTILALILPIAIRFIGKDTPVYLGAGLGVFLITAGLIHYRKFVAIPTHEAGRRH